MMAMKKGQKAFFYHSNCKVPGIAGIVEVAREAFVDHTQFDPKDPHYDPKSSKVVIGNNFSCNPSTEKTIL